MKDLETKLRTRLDDLHSKGPGTIGDMLQLELVDVQSERGIYTMRGKTAAWMRNIAGTLHGGMCATLIDQAMGCVAFSAKPGEGIAPTIEMNVSYHRPLTPGEDVLIHVRLVSPGKRMIHLAAEAYEYNAPDKLCISATGIYFYKSAEEMR